VRYTNDTRSTLAFYDTAGVKLVNIGVGMGRALCMCFAMATNTAVAYDMCWYFNEIGQYWIASDGYGSMVGSYRPGAAKSLPHCSDVDVNQLEQQWTATAVMPQATGPVETVNLGPSTVLQTVTQTSTLTPTSKTFLHPRGPAEIDSLTPVVNLTISSSTVVTGRDGSPTTEDRSYTTTAAVINFEPAADQGMSLGNRIALGVGLGLGLPTFFLALVACWRAGRTPPPVPPKNNSMFQRHNEY
jgi:hypothetical protein